MLPQPFNLLSTRDHRHHKVSKGDYAFRQDDKTQGLFFVNSGSVELRRYTEDGRNVVIHRANPRETFAEASLFSENYHCDAIALQDCKLIELDRRALLNKFKSEPNFAIAIAHRFASQTQGYRRKLEILGIRNAEERIFAAVCEGLLSNNVKDFAADIGLSHEAVYRGLATLVKQGELKKISRGKYSL